jgi:hypothetical protein
VRAIAAKFRDMQAAVFELMREMPRELLLVLRNQV